MKIYVDMDGVLTNFDDAVKKIGAGAILDEEASTEEKDKAWKMVEAAGTGFWSEMEWAPDGQKLWKLVSKINPNPVLLSSPGDITCAIRGKKEWIDKNMPGTAAFFEKVKSPYAERNAVLIDDTTKHVEAWKDAGGIGILHKNFEDTERQLLELLLKPDLQPLPSIP